MPRADAAGPSSGSDPSADSGSSGSSAQGPVRRTSSHRRPLETTGTFPPEGSAAAAGRGQPVTVRQWPIVVVLTMVAVGLAVTALNQFRPGVITIGAALMVGCLLRSVLPEVGMLAVRSRFTDVLVMGILGIAIILLALASEPNPLITLPLLPKIAGFFGRNGG